MIYSMTGFGRGMASNETTTVTIEMATVNRKQFDASISLPKELMTFEARIQMRLKQVISRGTAKVNIVITQDAPTVDIGRAKVLIDSYKAIAQTLDLPCDLSARDLLLIPEIARGNSHLQPTDELYALISEALEEAIIALQAMCAHEGSLIVADLRQRLTDLATIRDQVREITLTLPDRHKETLQKRLAHLLPENVTIEPEALAREVAFFADKCDVTEEMTRLAAHFDHAEKLFAESNSCGRPLDFLCQELLREINTTGSKANNAQIAHHVIAFKTLLETFREQVQNLM